MSQLFTVFVPHYGDHARLSFQLGLFQKYSDTSKLVIVIYDSSPIPAESVLDFSEYKDLSIKYKICCQEVKGNTYSSVFKEFCQSQDSDNGGFILPIDEFIYLNISDFENRPDNIPYSCANQISLDPTSFKIAEYERCADSGIRNASEHEEYNYFPQIHATYFPATHLKSFGKFLELFLKTFGNSNSLLFDLLILEILHYSEVYYSKNSYYLQEKLPKRKTAGVFVHPSNFISQIDHEKREILFNMINKNIYEPLKLTYKQRKQITKKILSSKNLQRALFMPNVNSTSRLFKLIKDSKETIKVEKIDTFIAYHLITMETQSGTLKYIFNNRSFLGDEVVLELSRYMLSSYPRK